MSDSVITSCRMRQANVIIDAPQRFLRLLCRPYSLIVHLHRQCINAFAELLYLIHRYLTATGHDRIAAVCADFEIIIHASHFQLLQRQINVDNVSFRPNRVE